MKKAVIGVLALVDTSKKSYWMLPGYMKGIEQAGGIPVMLPLTDDKSMLTQLCDLCDGFLFTGGHDVSPYVYSEETRFNNVETFYMRDSMEGILLDLAIKKNKSVLGICRGIQFINAHLGGTLYQDLPQEIKSTINHHQSPPYDVPCHTVKIIDGTPLSKLLNVTTLGVNSYHHQAIKKLSDRLKPMAYSPDGLIEAVYMPSCKFVQAVQWHPEFSYKNDPASKRILKAFVESAVK